MEDSASYKQNLNRRNENGDHVFGVADDDDNDDDDDDDVVTTVVHNALMTRF